MPKNELTARELQSRGGKARARNLSPERRREIAAMGGKARQAKPQTNEKASKRRQKSDEGEKSR